MNCDAECSVTFIYGTVAVYFFLTHQEKERVKLLREGANTFSSEYFPSLCSCTFGALNRLVGRFCSCLSVFEGWKMCYERGGIAIVEQERKSKKIESESLFDVGERKSCVSFVLCMQVFLWVCVCDVDVKYAIQDMVANLRRIKIEHAK